MADSTEPRQRRGLGRGLGALITQSAAADPAAQEDLIAQAEAGGIQWLPLASIQPNPHQPRGGFDESALDELAASIAAHGLLQPIIVTSSPGPDEGYQIIAGERRWRAAHRAELEEVPAIVREATPQQLLEWALVENLQRADLSPLEEAAAYADLMESFGLTQARVAERVGRSRSAVANALRLLGLPPTLQDALNEEQISAGHARALLALPDAPAMEDALAQVLARDLTVRRTEHLVRRMLDRAEDDADEAPAQPDAHLRSLEERFRTTLGTRVHLDRREDGSGRLVVHFYSDDDLAHIYRQIVGEESM